MKYYVVVTEDLDDINMVAGLIKLGILEEEPDVHHYDYCDHSYCHDECVSYEQVDQQVSEAVDEAVEEKEEEVLDNLDDCAIGTLTLEDAGCGCHSKVESSEDGLIGFKAGEYYLIHTDKDLR